MQGKSLAGCIHTKNHDNFGLAVLIFYLLFMGRHPFAGQPIGKADPPTMQEAIKNFRFAYSSRHNETRLAPPPHTATLPDVPPDIRDAFETAFGQIGVTKARPAASDWVRILSTCEKALVTCKQSPSHEYFGQAKNCPWCRMERAVPGFFAFPVTFQQGSDQADTLKGLLSRFHAVAHPAPTPDLASLMPSLVLSPSIDFSAEDERQKQRAALGLIVAVAGSAALGSLPSNFTLLALGAILVSAVIYFSAPKVSSQFGAVEAKAAAEWRLAKQNREIQNSTRDYYSFHERARELARTAEKFDGEERAKIDALYAERHKNQLRAFLSGFQIERANIKGIGQSRKVVLRSYGIETAADIDMNRVRYIKGFGPKRAQTMVDWRKSIERRFTFNSHAAVDPADVARVKAEFSRKRSDMITKLGTCLGHIEAERSKINSRRAMIDPAIIDCWEMVPTGIGEFSGRKKSRATNKWWQIPSRAGDRLHSVIHPLAILPESFDVPTNIAIHHLASEAREGRSATSDGSADRQAGTDLQSAC